MLADGTDDEFLSFLNSLELDEMLDTGGSEFVARADSWDRIPHSYVRLTEDRSIPLAPRDRFIAEADKVTPATRSTSTPSRALTSGSWLSGLLIEH